MSCRVSIHLSYLQTNLQYNFVSYLFFLYFLSDLKRIPHLRKSIKQSGKGRIGQNIIFPSSRHLHTHTYTHTLTHTHTPTHTHTLTNTLTHTHTHTLISQGISEIKVDVANGIVLYICVCEYVCVCIYIWVYLCVCVYIYMCVCVCVYKKMGMYLWRWNKDIQIFKI